MYIKWCYDIANHNCYGREKSGKNLLTQLEQESTPIPDIANQAADTFDLFLTSHPEKYTIEVSAPLGFSVAFSLQTNVVALDISNVFDRVWHAAIISKMESCGISVALLRWAQSFLSGTP